MTVSTSKRKPWDRAEPGFILPREHQGCQPPFSVSDRGARLLSLANILFRAKVLRVVEVEE